MWILFRIIALVVVGLSRLLSRLQPSTMPCSGYFQQTAYFEKIENDKHGEMQSFQLGMALPGGLLFSLHNETSTDGLFKSLGLANEYQTGDLTFDQKVYLACDHPQFGPYLAGNAVARGLTTELLSQPGMRYISSDGETLWIHQQSKKLPEDHVRSLLLQLTKALSPLCQRVKQQPDPFFWPFLWVEAFVWGWFGYAAMAVLEYRLTPEDIHLQPMHVVQIGLLAGGALFLLSMFFIAVFLNGSSRGHRIVVESLVLLLLALPISGVQLVAEINRQFDQAPPQTLICQVINKEQQQKRRKYGSSTTYYIYLMQNSAALALGLPDKIEVSAAQYALANLGQSLALVIQPGYLGLPWIKQFKQP